MIDIWNKLKGELIDIIEWLDDTNDTIAYRFERYDNEIKYGAQLTVRPGQVAVFVNEGRIADVFQPGRYELVTQNVPVLATLQGWKYGFSSPFKAEVYFVNTKIFTNLKWGTMNPVMLRDEEFGPVRVRAFGTYAMRVTDAASFIPSIAGTDGRFTTDEIVGQLRNLIVSRFPVAVGNAKLPILDLAANYDNLAKIIGGVVEPEFKGMGLELVTLLVENVSLPEEVEKMLDKRSSMGLLGDLGRYTQMQTADAIKAAAENPNGMAGFGVAMGTGGGLANAMGAAFMGSMGSVPTGGMAAPAAHAGASPPPLPGALPPFHVAINGVQAGPFSDLTPLMEDGRLTRDSLVWTAGMPGWVKAGEVAALAVLFANQPPPLP